METKIDYRLKKAEAGEIFGPLSDEKLKELAESALIAPTDLVDKGDEQWIVASDVDFLGMVWVVETGSGQIYGPTSVGTIREFYAQGEIKLTDSLTHSRSKETKTVSEVLGIDLARAELLESPPEPAVAAAAPVAEPVVAPVIELPALDPNSPIRKFDGDAMKNLERAKDLRIRQLEVDLEKAREEHEQLLHKFRKLTEDYIQIKKAMVT